MELEEIERGIWHYIRQIHEMKQWGQPSRLSDTMMKLTTLNAYLGGHLANLEDAYISKERESYLKHEEDGASTTKAKEMAKYESTDERRAYKHFNLLHSDTDKVANRIQSRIKVLEAERRNEQ